MVFAFRHAGPGSVYWHLANFISWDAWKPSQRTDWSLRWGYVLLYEVTALPFFSQKGIPAESVAKAEREGRNLNRWLSVHCLQASCLSTYLLGTKSMTVTGWLFMDQCDNLNPTPAPFLPSSHYPSSLSKWLIPVLGGKIFFFKWSDLYITPICIYGRWVEKIQIHFFSL